MGEDAAEAPRVGPRTLDRVGPSMLDRVLLRTLESTDSNDVHRLHRVY